MRKELIFMAKQKVYSEKEMAMIEFLNAQAELQRAEDMFGWANEEYFEIANMELTIAKLKYEVALKKMMMLCKDGKDLPKINMITAVSKH